VNPRDESFDKLVARIDEGEPIDWDAELRKAPNADDRQLIEGLRTLASVATLVRTSEFQNTAAPPSGTPWRDLVVFEAVGKGAFGTVHRAVDSLNRTVALKLLDPGRDVVALRERILEEGRLLARVRHPNIVVVHGAGVSDGRVGLWMEFIDGWTLAAEIDAQGPMCAEDAATIGRKLCGTLIAIHGEGCVHADVKAQNVMRERGGRVVLMDFGAGQPLADGDNGRLAGTPLYLSPERLAGAPLSPSCDIYALGVLLYFLVTGAYPVDGETREDVERAHRDGVHKRLRDRRPDLPDAYVAAVEGAISRDPANRYATAGEFEAALARVAAAPAQPAPPVAPPRRRGWRMPVIAAAMIVPSALAGWWAVSDRNDTPARPLAAAATPTPVLDGYRVQATFYQLAGNARQPKAAGTRIATGDVLELDIRLSHDASVYVVNEDDQGRAFLLFPLAGGSLRNPLPAGRAHTLPGPSGAEPVQWEVDSIGGREHFYVIVAPEADPVLQSALDRLRPASDTPAPSLNAQANPEQGGLRGVRGTSKLAHKPAPAGARDAPWRTLAQPLLPGEEQARGVWVRELILENPRR
jgi:hypothetical protein